MWVSRFTGGSLSSFGIRSTELGARRGKAEEEAGSLDSSMRVRRQEREKLGRPVL